MSHNAERSKPAFKMRTSEADFNLIFAKLHLIKGLNVTKLRPV